MSCFPPHIPYTRQKPEIFWRCRCTLSPENWEIVSHRCDWCNGRCCVENMLILLVMPVAPLSRPRERGTPITRRQIKIYLFITKYIVAVKRRGYSLSLVWG